MKTLVIVTHPNMEASVINKRWIAEMQKHPEQYQIHELYKSYPSGKIDVPREQALIEAHDRIIFQFPLYWFSSPPLLKQWLDEVLAYGWAYGSKSGYKAGGKKIALAITAGIDEEEYLPGARYKYTLQELTRPFELTFEYIRADYRGFHAFYGIELNASEARIESSVAPYMDFLASFAGIKKPASCEAGICL
ncbi:NAD(P)H-dependent oxidoreductase [Chitinophaga pollutisoli]|uniref:NAD(P)H-dependent oxidoreductase n=1 Tax=Chitinophaga pollutisoli TaxID=3133966 RepID=A0ABZ2YN79_9BACT